MADHTTYVIFLADESSSMSHLRDSSISSFNEYIDDLKSGVEGDVRLTLAKFNTAVEVVYANRELAKVRPLTHKTYSPGGMTALYDAIGEGVKVTEDSMREGDRAICIVMTDGQENASREMTRSQVRSLIANREAKDNWSFVYLGSDAATFTGAGAIGIATGNVASYQATGMGHAHGMKALANMTVHSHNIDADTFAATKSTRYRSAGIQLKTDGSVPDAPDTKDVA